MNFIPDAPAVEDVPYFETAKKEDGWQGQATTKSLKTLQKEVEVAIARLGGSITRVDRGMYHVGKMKRAGIQFTYIVADAQNNVAIGRIEIAALPVKMDPWQTKRWNAKQEQSLCMALYIVRMVLDSQFLMQKLSPGYSALVPFMLTDNDKTISQRWIESPMLKPLLPAGDSSFEVIDAEVKE